MKNKINLLLLTTLLFTSVIAFGQQADDLIGIWEPSNGKVRVKIEKLGTKYFGRIVWLRAPLDSLTNKPKVDKNNPDEALRNVPLKGFRLLKDFSFKSAGEWADGTIYDPENGSTYSCTIKMKDKNTLDIRGYIGISAFGRTDIWKRLELKKQ
jgi:uncharacterized protein (DUF2147 family)